ncbi:MAG: S-layer homology domain-containing protein, partial [Clostridia bacterium]|nr:S-layer homology domain-containing protein [Clostridia bacterium]
FSFRVVNGTWNDGTDGDITFPASYYSDEGSILITPNDYPAVGDKPAKGFLKSGSWKNEFINEDTFLVYTYDEDPNYVPDDVTGNITFSGKVNLDGRPLTDSDVFTFEVLIDGIITSTAQNDATGEIFFTQIDYGSNDVGTHVYTVKQNGTNIPGVTIDETEYTVTVIVSYNRGDDELTVTPTEEFSSLNFNNTYTKQISPEYSVPAELKAAYGKTLADVTLPDGWTWNDPPATGIGNVGYNSFSATYTPKDTVLYKTVTENLTIAVSGSFTVVNIPMGGENTATIGNNVEISYDTESCIIVPDKYAESLELSEKQEWFEGVYSSGFTFTGSVLVIPLNGATLDENVNFNITNGTFVKAEKVLDNDGKPTGELRVFFNVRIEGNASVLGTVSITDFPIPNDKDGVFEPEIADGEHYTVDDAFWTDKNGQPVEKFEAGSDYFLNVMLTLERGYVFADSVNVSVNGNSQTVKSELTPGKIKLKIKVYVAYDPHTVKFNANNGRVTPESGVTNKFGKLDSLPVPERSNHTFNGWFTEKTGGKEVTTDTLFEADGEIFAQWTRKSAGGSVSIIEPEASYKIISAQTENGTVQITPKSAKEGATVRINAVPNEGYRLEKITVINENGKEIQVRNANGEISFIMPKGGVEVFASFVKDDSGYGAGFNNPFTDVKPADYFFEPVMWALRRNITTGTTATTFSPEESCTRAEMVTFLWRTAGSPESSATIPFTDVKAGEYYHKAVLWAYEKGITTGTTATAFSPDKTCTRAEMVTFLWRMSGSPEPKTGNNPFNDVKAGEYYHKAVIWAYENGITIGTTATTFGTNEKCTRAETVTFLYRMEGGK